MGSHAVAALMLTDLTGSVKFFLIFHPIRPQRPTPGEAAPIGEDLPAKPESVNRMLLAKKLKTEQ